jgi:methylated-DNA-protein-cysteine methyltransferase-like protein
MPIDTAAFRKRVLALIRKVPAGRVVTYGQVAFLLGQPRHARLVGHILYGLTERDPAVPWQRVINANGKLSTYRIGTGDLQRQLLEEEGVTFDGENRADLERYQWWPSKKVG